MTHEKLKKTLRKSNNSKKCERCGTSRKLTIDHIIPLSIISCLNLGPIKNVPENLQILCVHCNHLKGNKLDHNNPKTARLLDYYISEWHSFHKVRRQPRKKYVYRTLPVISHSVTTQFLSEKNYLKSIYERQSSKKML